MPYIKEEDRTAINTTANYPPVTAGQLNYVITKIIKEYWTCDQSYKSINDIVGALEGAKLEFYRRIATPYEDKKIIENGDVY